MKNGVKKGAYLYALITGLSILVYTPKVFPAPKVCEGIIEELQMMKRAQNQIIVSLADNHEMFATHLSDLSFELAIYKNTVPKKALIAMEKSAQAYRSRGTKAKGTAEDLKVLTEDLIQKIQGCLK